MRPACGPAGFVPKVLFLGLLLAGCNSDPAADREAASRIVADQVFVDGRFYTVDTHGSPAMFGTAPG